MPPFKSLGSLGVYAGLGIVFSAAPAHAYLDPGSGSVLLQLVLGGAAGAAILARAYWHRLKLLLRPSRDQKAKPDSATDSH